MVSNNIEATTFVTLWLVQMVWVIMMMARRSLVLVKMPMNVSKHLFNITLTYVFYLARKRLKEEAREHDSKIAKKARRLAESSGQSGSILKHLQTGVTVPAKPAAKDIASKLPCFISIQVYVCFNIISSTIIGCG